MSDKHFTLITGGSSGIGRAMAREFASRGHNLILVALPGTELEETQQAIMADHQIIVHVLGIDLTQDHIGKTVFEWCQENQYSVNILVNNAGFGLGGLFDFHDLKQYNQMIKLNNIATVELTHNFLSHLKQNKPSYILNMSSLEATLPLPYKTVYAATKGFLYSFSLALREELKSHDVSVSVLCPGPVINDNPENLKRIASAGMGGKMLVMFPKDVAKEAIPGLLRRKQVIIPGMLNKTLVKVGKLFPTSMRMPILEKIFRSYSKQAEKNTK